MAKTSHAVRRLRRDMNAHERYTDRQMMRLRAEVIALVFRLLPEPPEEMDAEEVERRTAPYGADPGKPQMTRGGIAWPWGNGHG